MDLRRTRDGLVALAAWRDAPGFLSVKGAALAAEWNVVRFNRLPYGRRFAPLIRFGARLPYPSQAFDVVYLLHILEHHSDDELPAFYGELRRILKPGGILRLSTPDLELDCRLYLEALDRAARNPSPENEAFHQLAIAGAVDQKTRIALGGEMLRLLHARRYREEDLRRRFGLALDHLRPETGVREPDGWRKAWPGDAPFALLRKLAARLTRGRVHLWCEYDLSVHDEFSVRAGLEAAGFTDVRAMPPGESAIPGWSRFDLDRRGGDDDLIEPSLYLEARRPQTEDGHVSGRQTA